MAERGQQPKPDTEEEHDTSVEEVIGPMGKCSLNEEESMKWKPLPPIDSTLPREEKEKKLKERRYSTSLARRLVEATDFTDAIKKVEESIKSSQPSEAYDTGTYVLVDPRSYDCIGPEPIDFDAFIRGVFYIGEGKILRCADHFATDNPKALSIIKDSKIESIWEEGKTPTAVVCTQGETKKMSQYKEAMMIKAYGYANVSCSGKCSVENYEQGMLVNKQTEEYRCDKNDLKSWEEYGVNLLVMAWKTYKKHDKQRNGKLPAMACAVRIVWSTNPKEVQRCKVQCSVCKNCFFPKHGKCHRHWITNEDCSGSREPPFPNSTLGEDEMKIGACNICKLACKLMPQKSPKKSAGSSPLVVMDHVDSQRCCDGSQMTLEEMEIVLQVKKL